MRWQSPSTIHYEAVKEVKKDYKNPDEGIADAMDALKHPEKYETEGQVIHHPGS